MAEIQVPDKKSAVFDDINDDDEKIQAKAEEVQVPSLTIEAVNDLKDAIEAMELAEDHGINIDELESVEEIQTRLKCHLKLVNEGNLKEKVINYLTFYSLFFVRTTSIVNGKQERNVIFLFTYW